MRSALFAYIMNKLRERAVYQSPLLLLFILLVTIFTVEFTIMFLIHYLGIPEWSETVVDSFSLSIVIFPVLYLFIFRPLKLYITELKNLADMLHDSRDSLNRLLDSMVEGVYGIDTNGNCTFINQAALQIMGYQNEDELVGKQIHTLIHHSHSDGSPYPASKCRIYYAYQTIQTINVSDEVFWRKDGIAVSVEYWSRPIVIDGVVTGAIVSFIDITERKKAEDKLLESDRTIKAFMNAISDAMFLIDAAGNILLLNEATALRFGKSEDEFIGACIYDYLPPDLSRSRRAHVNEVIRCGKSVSFEDERNGEWIDNSIYPLFDEQEKVVKLAIYARYITEHKKSEDELKRVNEELHEKTKYLERFNRLMVSRELEMIKLKAEVNELLEKSGQPKKYAAPDEVKDGVRAEIWR